MPVLENNNPSTSQESEVIKLNVEDKYQNFFYINNPKLVGGKVLFLKSLYLAIPSFHFN